LSSSARGNLIWVSYKDPIIEFLLEEHANDDTPNLETASPVVTSAGAYYGK